jgi:hypothetical protein
MSVFIACSMSRAPGLVPGQMMRSGRYAAHSYKIAHNIRQPSWLVVRLEAHNMGCCNCNLLHLRLLQFFRLRRLTVTLH